MLREKTQERSRKGGRDSEGVVWSNAGRINPGRLETGEQTAAEIRMEKIMSELQKVFIKISKY